MSCLSLLLFAFLFCGAYGNLENPTSGTQWSIYYTACIEWDSTLPVFAGDTTATFTLYSESTSVLIASNVPISDQQIPAWKVYGVLPSDSASVEMVLDTTSTSVLSETFEVTLPIVEVTGVCVGVTQACAGPVGCGGVCLGSCPTGAQCNTNDGGDSYQCEFPPVVFFNEIHYDNAGADENESVEVAGTAGTDLVDWTVQFIRQDGTFYQTVYLTGIIGDEGEGFGAISFDTAASIQNGPNDGFCLIDQNDAVIEFLSYEGTVTATNGKCSGRTSTDIGVAEDSNTTGATKSLQRQGCYEGDFGVDFTWGGPIERTQNALNTDQYFLSCP